MVKRHPNLILRISVLSYSRGRIKELKECSNSFHLMLGTRTFELSYDRGTIIWVHVAFMPPLCGLHVAFMWPCLGRSTQTCGLVWVVSPNNFIIIYLFELGI